LGIAALEDKIVQGAVVQVHNQIWEEDFVDFSYGFRPERSQHDALDALAAGMTGKKGNYVVDLEIRSFFDKVGYGSFDGGAKSIAGAGSGLRRSSGTRSRKSRSCIRTRRCAMRQNIQGKNRVR